MNSQGSPLPEEYRQSLETALVRAIDLSYHFHQQRDSHNCGLWALENAANINRMLDENKPLGWVVEQLKNSRDADYFQERRKSLSEKLRVDSARKARRGIYPTISVPESGLGNTRVKRSDVDPQEARPAAVQPLGSVQPSADTPASLPRFNEERQAWEIGSPVSGEANLLWSVTLAYLIPVKNNDRDFKKRFKNLFGKKAFRKQYEEIKQVQRQIQTYNPFSSSAAMSGNELLKELITKTFSKRVTTELGGDGAGELTVRQLEAISELLDVQIHVVQPGAAVHDYGDGDSELMLTLVQEGSN